jgi:hypothetical protein
MGVEVADGPGNLAAILVLVGAGVTGRVSFNEVGSSGLTSCVGGCLKQELPCQNEKVNKTQVI